MPWGLWRVGGHWAPCAAAYGAVVLARRWAYDQGLFSVWRPPVPTVSVGSLEAGGVGKSTIAALLLWSAQRAGRRPGLLTRGYGRASKGLVVRPRNAPARWRDLGDEPAMLLGAGIDVDIAACASRREGARALCALGCDALILDDGFTHRAIARDIDIVVLRDGAPKGSNHLLPWGTLREPTSSLGRADVVWHHCRGKESSPAEARAECAEPRPARSGLLRVESVQRPGVTTDANGAEVSLVGKNIVGACGIGHPQDFFGAILAAGARPTSKVTFGDHHDFTQADVARLVREAERSEATVVVTPKDWAKLAAMREAAGFLVLGIEIELTTGSEGLAERLGWPLPRRFALGAGLAQGRYE